MSMVRVTGGVGTHADFHVAAVVVHNGGLLGIESFGASEAGYENLVGWLIGFGSVDRVGVEGTGSYGVGLARFLTGGDIEVVEVDRPNRQVRAKKGKSDPTDAVAAARAALCGEASVTPKTRNGRVEQMRVLLVVRRSARQQGIQSLNQLRQVTFPQFVSPGPLLRLVPVGLPESFCDEGGQHVGGVPVVVLHPPVLIALDPQRMRQMHPKASLFEHIGGPVPTPSSCTSTYPTTDSRLLAAPMLRGVGAPDALHQQPPLAVVGQTVARPPATAPAPLTKPSSCVSRSSFPRFGGTKVLPVLGGALLSAVVQDLIPARRENHYRQARSSIPHGG